ncbi:MAG: CopG family transcriptional regulator [Candidatus Nanohalarchaeota archaeon]|nr:MAG: CopG family transcriptional regulator [Candidatus Nanohaloarchaeota archaeon]
MKVIQIRLPMKLLEKIDELIKEDYYSSRSECIREKIRESLKE